MKLREQYLSDTDILNADEFCLEDYRKEYQMEEYVRRPIPWGYVRAADLFDAGTCITVRTLGGDEEFYVEPDMILTIGPKGEVYRNKKAEFESFYRFYPDWQYRLADAEYDPTIKVKDTGKLVQALEFSHVCVPKGNRTYRRADEGEKVRRRAVVFDLDGTLMDTLEDLKNAVNSALAFGKMPLCTLEQVRTYVGNGVRNLMIRAVPGGADNPAFAEVFRFFLEYYDRHCMDHSAPYRDILSLLEELHAQEVPMAIVSNKVDSAVKELNRRFFADYISVALGDRLGAARKPAPDTVYLALSELGVLPEDAVYVGDSDVDVETAANAGLPCVSVTWGFRDEPFLRAHGAQTLIQRPLELLYLI